ncbi:Uma2 family endonuclease [Acidisoma sp. 7E03]
MPGFAAPGPLAGRAIGPAASAGRHRSRACPRSARQIPKRKKTMPNRAIKTTMNAPLRKAWTQDEFLSWAERQETRYEFDGFQPVAMTGGDAGHSRVIRGLHRSLDRRLNGGPCEPLGPDAGVETANHAVRYPDALVTCTKFDNQTKRIPGVVIVFEVISPSTSRIDRIVKVREYAAVSSIRRYVILESTSIGLTVLERTSPDQAWQTTVLTGEDILRLPEVGIEIPVAEIYDGIDFEDLPES